MTTIFKVLLTGSLLLSFSVFADYEFKGQTFKLMPFKSAAPKTVNKDFTSLNGLPKTLSLKDMQTPVKSQGNRGACAYFSTTALTESLIKKETGEEVNISEEYLIYNGKAVYGYSSRSDGSNGRQNLYVMRDGFFLEKDMPYQPSWFEKGLPCGNQNENGAPVRCYAHDGPTSEISDREIDFQNFQVVDVISSSSGVIKAMNENGSAVVVGLPLHPEGWNGETGHCVYNEEYRRKCDQDPNAGCGGHSILLTGYDMEKEVFYFKNSWGFEWGKKGYGTLPFEYIDRYASWSTVTAKYAGSLDIPSGHNEVPAPYATGVEYAVDMSNGIKVSMTGKFTNVLNRVFYTSTFVAYKKDAGQPIGDQNADMLMVPENMRNQYGWYLRGADYVLQRGVNEIVVDESDPAVMEIPSLIVNPVPGVSEYFLRISAYIYDDVNGWNKIYRVYKPVQL